MNVPDWKNRAEFDAWWKAHGDEFRRLSARTPPRWVGNDPVVTDPEYLRIAALIEKFNKRCPPSGKGA